MAETLRFAVLLPPKPAFVGERNVAVPLPTPFPLLPALLEESEPLFF